MHYIFDLDDTLLLSEVIKKRTYFDYIKKVENLGKVTPEIAQKALDKVNDILFNIGEKDVFDTARQSLIAMGLSLSIDEIDFLSRQYVEEQMILLRHNYQTEVSEVKGVSACLRAMKASGSILGINTGNAVTFAKSCVQDRKWPIDDSCVFGAGDTPEDNPYSLEMKVNNIRLFSKEIIRLKPEQYKSERDALNNITMVGDGVFDYLSAQQLGCSFIGVKPRAISKLDKYEDIFVVHDFIEFCSKFNQTAARKSFSHHYSK